MISAKKDAFLKNLKSKSKDEVIAETALLFDRCEEAINHLKELQNANTEIALQFAQMRDELAGVKEENKILREQNLHLAGIQKAQNRDLYGQKSEAMSDIVNGSNGETPKNPTDEDAGDCDAPNNGASDDGSGISVAPNSTVSGCGNKPGKKSKNGGRKARDLSGLPVQKCFEYDVREIDEKYGKNAWYIQFWREHESVERIRPQSYVKKTYTPVIADKYGYLIGSVPYEGAVLPKSIASSSLLSELVHDKHRMFLPLYRIENDENRYGFSLSRQTMSTWITRVGLDLLRPVYDYLREILKRYRYQQCDETPYTVIMDGRKSGSRCFIWVHRSSELMAVPEIILYCMEKTRGSQHLINFYEGLVNEIFLTCDAYSAYGTLEAAMPELVTICGCFMHMRRRFALDLIFNYKNCEPDDSIPSFKAIRMIMEIYLADEALKPLSAEERYERRQTNVKPKVEALFEYLHTLDPDDPSYSERLKDAIQYALNQEKRLRMFLTDGNIPIDDGSTERNVKPVAQIRKNSLFSYSMDGAQSMVVILSLIETAKANGADTFFYIKYLIEQMSKKVYYYHDEIRIEAMLPWSDEYRQYENEQKQLAVDLSAPPGNEMPTWLMKTKKLYVA